MAEAKIPRWLGCTKNDNLECHIFTDASLKAYGAVAYIRISSADGVMQANVPTSLSKVAPQTVPRLEFFAAKLKKYVQDTSKE